MWGSNFTKPSGSSSQEGCIEEFGDAKSSASSPLKVKGANTFYLCFVFDVQSANSLNWGVVFCSMFSFFEIVVLRISFWVWFLCN